MKAYPITCIGLISRNWNFLWLFDVAHSFIFIFLAEQTLKVLSQILALGSGSFFSWLFTWLFGALPLSLDFYFTFPLSNSNVSCSFKGKIKPKGTRSDFLFHPQPGLLWTYTYSISLRTVSESYSLCTLSKGLVLAHVIWSSVSTSSSPWHFPLACESPTRLISQFNPHLLEYQPNFFPSLYSHFLGRIVVSSAVYVGKASLSSYTDYIAIFIHAIPFQLL